MNISKVSFGSTYTVKAKDNKEESYIAAKSFDPKIYDWNSKLIYSYGYTPDEDYTKIAIDDKYDKVLETYFKQNNIVFNKKTNNELFDIDNIKTRIRNSNIKYDDDRYLPTLVNISTEKFEKAFRNSWQYVGDKQFLQNNDRYNSVKDYLKLDLPIDASEVYVTDKGKFPEITFQDGRHRYAYFRDMGMKTIPVSMNKESYNVALKYSLLG